jgi:hypothetical protein
MTADLHYSSDVFWKKSQAMKRTDSSDARQKL